MNACKVENVNHLTKWCREYLYSLNLVIFYEVKELESHLALMTLMRGKNL